MEKRSNKKRWLVIMAVSVTILVFILLRKGDGFEDGALSKITLPMARFFSAAGSWTNDRYMFFSSIGEMRENNTNLLEENLELKSQLAEIKDVKKENEELRKQIALAPKNEHDLEAAIVVGRDVSGQSQIIYIDKGLDNGIEKDMAVVVGKGVLIGRVISTTPSTAKIQLLVDRKAKINAEIVESGAKGIVEGQFGIAVALSMIPQTEEINKGDTIITSGVGDVLPRGLLIGHVQDVASTADQLFQRASINLPSQIDKFRMVWVVK